MPPAHPAPADTLARIRTALLAVYVLGAAGTAVELGLLEHTEDVWQWVPIVLLALGLVTLAWFAARRGAAPLRAFQGTMLLSLVSGVVGTVLHYQGNVEFEREMEPTLRGLALLWEALRGATPALAPGTMIQLGLVGLAYTYRHPALARADAAPPPER